MSEQIQRELGTNGHSLPLDWQGVPDDVIQRMELAYQEIQRRDSQAEQRAWRKDTLVQRLGLVIVVLIGVLVWLVLTKAQVGARRVDQVQQRDRRALAQQGEFLHRRLPAELEVGDSDMKDPAVDDVAEHVLAN